MGSGKNKSQINVNNLPMAINEYKKRLISFLQPLILKGLHSIYKDAKVYCENSQKEHEIFKRFQFYLKKTRHWSSLIVDKETERIKEKVSYIEPLIIAIFVAHVKLLGCIRLKGKYNNIKVKVPSCNNFIHTVYINTAKRVYYNPKLFEEDLSFIDKEKNMDKIYEYIEKGIVETISQMLPMEHVLNEYVANAFDEDVSCSEESGSESENCTLISEKSEMDLPKKKSIPLIDFGNKKPVYLEENSEGSVKSVEENVKSVEENVKSVEESESESEYESESESEYESEGESEGESESEELVRDSNNLKLPEQNKNFHFTNNTTNDTVNQLNPTPTPTPSRSKFFDKFKIPTYNNDNFKRVKFDEKPKFFSNANLLNKA
jgi:hypothetical protein